MTAPRVICICLDSAEKGLLLAWAGRGELPNLEALLNRSAWSATLPQNSGLYVGPIWPSFNTGQKLETHGKYAERQLIPGTYEVRKVLLSEIGGAPFWVRLGERGHRTAVIDLAKSAVDGRVNGIQIAAWGAHDADYFDELRFPEAMMQTLPEELGPEIIARWPPRAFGWSDLAIGDGSGEAIGRFRDSLLGKIRTRTSMALDLLGREEWPLFMVSYGESHSVGHHCWHLTDETTWNFDKQLQGRIGDPVKDVYKAIDDAIGALAGRANPQTYVALFSSLGMGPHISGQPVIDTILRRLDRSRSARTLAYQGAREVWHLLPLALRTKLRSPQETSRNLLLARERASRRFFALHSNADFGAVRINLEGREPNGKVSPGRDFDRVCGELTEALLEVMNDETGERLVERVIRSDALYRRRPDDSLPDLMVEWRKSHPIRAVSSPRIGRIRVDSRERRTGDHRPEGLFCLAGPGIRPGRLGRPLSVLELAPTLCALLGESFDALDARPAKELLPHGAAPQRPVSSA